MKVYEDRDGKCVLVAELTSASEENKPILDQSEAEFAVVTVSEMVIRLRPGLKYMDWYERMAERERNA
jgi:hypothetical protein